MTTKICWQLTEADDQIEAGVDPAEIANIMWWIRVDIDPRFRTIGNRLYGPGL